MPTFSYVAKRGPEEIVEGQLEADSRTTALNQLTQLGYVPVRIVEAAAEAAAVGRRRSAAARRASVPWRTLHLFTRQFASLTRSQIPLLRALSILQQQTSHAALRTIVGQIAEDVRQGSTLSEALAKHPRIFSPLYVSLTRAGEAGGMLDTVLDRLAAQAQQESSMRAKIQGAMVYPCVVGVVGLITVIVLMTFVVPRLDKLFTTLGSQLPLPTRLLLGVAGVMSQPWFWVGALILVVLLGGVVRLFTEPCARAVDRLSLRLPGIKTVMQQLELGRFARAFGLLLEHGVPVLQAMDIAIPTVRHRLIRQELLRLPKGVQQGTPVSACMKELSVATPFIVNTLAVGEQGGRLSEALVEVANFYDEETERLLQTMATLLEPLMILAVGGVVGFIVAAVLLPIFQMSSAIR
ncbi:MAG: type II secretion system F family protein [Candidatus Omnitrophica bacterium]|nr:type II secretion system F family protein [Candidatus Omnitrophota bacterium]